MPEATTANVGKRLQDAIEAQERVKQAARDAANRNQNPAAPGPGTPPPAEPKA